MNGRVTLGHWVSWIGSKSKAVVGQEVFDMAQPPIRIDLFGDSRDSR